MTEVEAKQFANSYAALFSSPDASSYETVDRLSLDVSKCYRAGMTFFTNGEISRFEVVSKNVEPTTMKGANSKESQDQAAGLIAREMRKNIDSGLGTCLVLEHADVAAYSESAATVRLTWTFHPRIGSQYEGKTWMFTNIYGYRAASYGQPAGWEYVVRDNEVNEMKKVTGKAFNE